MNHLYLPIRCLFLLVAVVYPVMPQQSLPAQPILSLEQITTRAGIIFAGTVQKVEEGDRSVTHVTFLVEDGIRGVFSGQTIRVSEWKSSARVASRYRAGERLLVFFHAPSPNGLTSPVGGSAGVIRFADAETLKLTAEQANALRRSDRLRAAIPDSVTGAANIPSADFVRALRLVTTSQ